MVIVFSEQINTILGTSGMIAYLHKNVIVLVTVAREEVVELIPKHLVSQC